MPPSVIAVVNTYPRFDAVFDPVAGEMRMSVKKYTGIRPMADDLNAKTLPAEDLALVIVTGTSEKNDAARYRKNMSLLAQMAKHSKLKAVPVLFLGYKGDTNLSEACEGCGAAYLNLPVRKSALIDKIKTLTPRPPLPKGEGEFGKKSPVREPLSLRERGAAEPGVRADKIKAESERRLATVMFADISGFTAMSEKMDPEEVTGIMNGVFREMETVIKGHGGTIDKFIGDCVMALFGVPRALENAPLRAVNTAIDMRNRLYQFNKAHNLAIPLDIHIGMNTGPVVAGHVGGADKKDYTVMGDAVNLASRIEGASEKGQILVGPDTYRATENDFEYKTLPPVPLKGKAEPVPVYEVLSTKESAARRARPGARVAPRKKKGAAAGPDRMIFSEMVGRDEEMNELRHAVTGLVRGNGGIVSVIGEAGIGKSRLMAELKSDPGMKKVTLLEGQALSMGRTLSFHPIIDLLKNWAGISEEDQEGAQLAKLDRAVRAVHPDEADEIVPFVATMMGMKLTGKFAERVKGIEGEGLEKLIFKNVRALLIRGSEIRPMIIRIEDLHWADTSSIELLISLFRLARDHRIMFLNFFRPNYPDTGDRVAKTCREEYGGHGDTNPPSAFGHLPLSKGEAGRGIYTEILIQPLDGKESATLISNLLNIRGLPQSLRDQITGRAGGNPFFIEEVVRSLIDEGAVVRKGDSFAVTNRIHEVKVPLTINEVLMSRIDRLDEETRSLIRTASVIGRYFFYKIIAQVAENISDIDRRLSYLEDIQLIRERKRMDELEYLFRHALAQEAAYESILIQKRKELHLHVAQAIESVFSGRLHEFYGMLAYHYSMGENLDRAEEYMLRAGEEAMKASASGEALTFFRDAMDIYINKCGNSADPITLARMEQNIATAYMYRGHHPEAVVFFDRSLAHYGIKEQNNKFFMFAGLLVDMLVILWNLYVHTKKKKVRLDNYRKNIYQLVFLRGLALSSTNVFKCVVKTINTVRKIIQNVDISYSQTGFDCIAGGAGLFSWSGLSYPIACKLLNYTNDYIPLLDKGISTHLYDVVKSSYSLVTGNWDYEYDEYRVLHIARVGDSFSLASYFIFTINIILNRGELERARDILSKYEGILFQFNDKWLELIFYKSSNLYHLCCRDLEASRVYMGKELSLLGDVAQDSEYVFFWGMRALVGIIEGNLVQAYQDIEDIENIINEKKPLLNPHYLSCYLQARFAYHVACLDEAVATDVRGKVATLRRFARAAGKESIRNSRKYLPCMTESLRCRGTLCWLLGSAVSEGLLGFGKILGGFRALRHYRAAVRWWKKSIDTGTRLGARLELSRTYAEIGKRLGGRYLHVDADPEGGIPHRHARLPRALMRAHVYAEKHLGLTPEECLEKAEAMFREMGLEWDLAELEKVRQGAAKG